VIVAADLARYRKGISILLVGDGRDISGWTLLHQYGAAARFVPDGASEEAASRVLWLLAEEAWANTQLALTLRSVAVAPARRLESGWLTAFAGDVESFIIRAVHAWATSRHEHARLLGLGEGGLRAKLRKIPLVTPGDPPARSRRDRVLVVGSGPASQAFAQALDSGRDPVVLVAPGELHARAEATAGARAAVIEVDTLDGVVDAWTLRRVAPLVPLLLHGWGDARARALLRALGGLPEPRHSEQLAQRIRHVADCLIALGRTSTAADASCLGAGGVGQGRSEPQPIDLTDVVSQAKHELVVAALAQERTAGRAAGLLQVSVRTIHRILERGRGQARRL